MSPRFSRDPADKENGSTKNYRKEATALQQYFPAILPVAGWSARLR